MLAPTRFIGETATAFPTFTWFLPDDESVPVEFSLYAIQPSGLLELQHSVTLAYESGIGQYQLPAQTAMESDQSYLWQLILYCNPNRPSQSLVYEAEVILRSSPAPVTFAGSAINQSKALAEAGYWYDAIAVLGNQQTPEVSELRSILLSDVARLEDAMTENAAAAEPVE